MVDKKLVQIKRIKEMIATQSLNRKIDLLRWLDRDVRKTKKQSKCLGVPRKYCACGKFFFNQEKYLRHVTDCEQYKKEVTGE